MTRLNLVLLMAVLASALYLVRTQYESRNLFVQVDKANALAHQLEIDNERLQVEKRAQATPLRVEKLAKEQLQMRTSTPAITQYVTMQAAPAAAATTPSETGTSAGGRGRQVLDNSRRIE
ncbi:cell division protein FtsL [Rhodoferax koreense]|uniref:Cell division protein FtsL n=1 Tax=Rhodoferax koreensis TaxID=1842727 RepID=A0A1P8K1L9_9BURK|nr:cell division protein FtsL [Rhodoferax koreense]APW39904.1 cell division protein FtsL [Rhodoferax koreense]